MPNKEVEEALINVCKNHYYPNTESVIVPEPYIPYMLEKWNRILVLAESQNISLDDDYYKWLNELTSVQLMTRLGWKKWEEPIPPYRDKNKLGWIGVGPWDGRLGELVKSALRAIFEETNPNLKVEDIAVSNAVPWTKKRSGSRNERPDKEMQCKARKFWKEIFEIWNPNIRMIIVLGKNAQEAMNDAEIQKRYERKWLKLRHPSRAKKISYAHQAVEEFKNSRICLIRD
ncbi:MAG: uracil-DNA glycosylase family protein [Sedimentisphaerales bacterium]